MSYRNFLSRDGGRHHTDPTSSRFNNTSKYHQRGRGRGNNRPISNRHPTGGDDLDTITVSIGRNLTTDGTHGPSSSGRGRFVNHSQGPRKIYSSSSRMNDAQNSETKWWRVSIPQAGAIGKERVMSTLKVHCARQFQHYHVNQ
jgi:hypothetical protein